MPVSKIYIGRHSGLITVVMDSHHTSIVVVTAILAIFIGPTAAILVPTTGVKVHRHWSTSRRAPSSSHSGVLVSNGLICPKQGLAVC